jgi:hypothetical protein
MAELMAAKISSENSGQERVMDYLQVPKDHTHFRDYSESSSGQSHVSQSVDRECQKPDSIVEVAAVEEEEEEAQTVRTEQDTATSNQKSRRRFWGRQKSVWLIIVAGLIVAFAVAFLIMNRDLVQSLFRE